MRKALFDAVFVDEVLNLMKPLLRLPGRLLQALPFDEEESLRILQSVIYDFLSFISVRRCGLCLVLLTPLISLQLLQHALLSGFVLLDDGVELCFLLGSGLLLPLPLIIHVPLSVFAVYFPVGVAAVRGGGRRVALSILGLPLREERITVEVVQPHFVSVSLPWFGSSGGSQVGGDGRLGGESYVAPLVHRV